MALDPLVSGSVGTCVPGQPAASGGAGRISESAHPGQPGRRERGAEILEFALVIAALMMLVLGIVVFARAYNVYQTITRAAREGARMAVLPSAWNNGTGGQLLDPCLVSGTCSFTQPSDSDVYSTYIAPALTASALNPIACASTSSTDCVSNYSEQENWLDPSGTTGNQCGVIISFQYPFALRIPFLPSLASVPINISTHVQVRTEDQPAGASPTCGGNALP